jgi:BirA family biotin operon repressor/biotin-[acetyl-CoA-carboxylase] ligase
MQLQEDLDARLLTEASPWGITVQVLGETTSTNDELLRLGEAQAPAGTIIFAERQTAGRGQFQRAWASSSPLGIWFSLLLHLEISDATIPALSAFAAVALVEALEELGLGNPAIKAPNDVYLQGRKVAGILVETRVGRSPFAVVGIGLNVNHQQGDFPEEIRERATSLALAAGRNFPRNQVAAILLRALGRQERQMSKNPAALLNRWNSLLWNPV